MHFFQNTSCPGSKSILNVSEVLGCLLKSSFQILEFSMLFPTADESWGSGVVQVKASNGDGRLAPMGVILYSSRP